MHHGLRRAFSVVLIVIVLMAGMMPGSLAESFGGRWVSVEGSDLELFLPDAFEEADIGDAERESGYTAQYGHAGHQLGVGKWAVAADHDYDDEYAYNLELYGEEHVHAATLGGLRAIFCRDLASNTLMLLYPDGAGSVFFAVAYPSDDDAFATLCTAIFHSLRASKTGGAGGAGDEAADDELVEALLGSAEEALTAQDYARAEQLYIDGFEQTGDLAFLYNLGYLYAMPDTGKQDYAKSAEYYERAANGGMTPAMAPLGYMYSEEEYGMVDYQKARDWYEKGAEAGDSLCMYGLGFMLSTVRFDMIEPEKALHWFTEAAEAGHIGANFSIGLLYANEDFELYDLDKAAQVFTVCAESGDTNAMNVLVYMYGSDDFGMKNSALADKWRAEYKAATGEDLPTGGDSSGDDGSGDDGSDDLVATVVGSGSKTFTLLVMVPTETFVYEIHTDKTHLLEALLEIGMIEGEQASWGFNVTTVDSVEADYAEDGTYWAIYRYDNQLGEMVELEASIADTRIESGVSVFGFAFQQDS